MNDDHVTADGPARADETLSSGKSQPSNGGPESGGTDVHADALPEAEPIPPSSEAAEPFRVPQITALAESAEETTEAAAEPAPEVYHGPQPRGFIAEWVVTIILLLFGTTNLVQAFVIPTGSMEDTLKIGEIGRAHV